MEQPTKKQQTVLGLLAEGKDATAIAKRMKISTNGVYGHIRKLREKGLIDADGKPANGGAATVAAAESNGHRPESVGQVDEMVKAAIVTIEGRESEIDKRLFANAEERAKLDAEAKQLEDESKALASRKVALGKV